ncbi:MAG: DnaJ domain-containing protein [Deltaproteobacteria bacterium]|nr:DnaJ domain-containing protein [Deltaproteobacteria bacterium]
MAFKDPYTALGVTRHAPAEEIKKAYRRLAKRFHPDVNPGDKKAEERFKDISTAFDVLGDPKRRALWDEFGEVSTRPGFDEAKARQFRRQQEAASSGFEGMFGGSNSGGPRPEGDLGGMYSDFFTQRRRAEQRRRGQQQGPQDGDDTEGPLEVELREAVLGAEREVTVDRLARCPVCFGLRSRPDGRTRPCHECRGTGEVSRAGGLMTVECPSCDGSGKEPVPCENCQGQGQVREAVRLKVKIPPGVNEGSRIRLGGQGAPGSRGGRNGDLYLNVHLRPHPLVKVEGLDLLLELPVTLGEAVHGGEITAPTFEGPVKLKIPPGSSSGKKLRLRGRGLPALRGQGVERGDLYVILQLVSPPDSPAAREAGRKLDAFYPSDVREGFDL